MKGFGGFPPFIICTLYLAKPVDKGKLRGENEIRILKKMNIQVCFFT